MGSRVPRSGYHGSYGNHENHKNLGCNRKKRVPPRTGLEISPILRNVESGGISRSYEVLIISVLLLLPMVWANPVHPIQC